MSIKIKLAEKAVDVEKALNDYLVVREPKKLYEAMAHIPLAGGKRLRPVMAQLICEMVGGDGEKAINSKKLENLIKKFDQKWESKVHRTRELTEFIQII